MNVWELTDLCTPWCVHVVATLRIADHIAAGATEIDKLAAAAGADADSLDRVLRHLSGKGLFEHPAPGRFELNDAARGLLGEQVGLDLKGIGGRMAYAWGTLLSAVRTGKPAYDEAFGCGFWDDLDANPEVAASFDALMGPAGHGIPDARVLLDEAAWTSVRTVVDVGGGTGTLLAEILKARPGVRGTLVDLPRVAARARDTFETAGVADRVTIGGPSFFDPLPPGGDVYVLKSVLSDWPDKEAAAILKRCADAAQPGGIVAVLDVQDGDEPSPELLMMVLVGGRARSLADFRKLAPEAGLDVRAAGRGPSGRFIVECRPV